MTIMILMIIAFIIWRRRRRHIHDRRTRRIAEDLPDAMDLLLAALHAGLTPVTAIDLLAHHAPPSVRPAFRAVVDRFDSGVRFGEALEEVPRLLGAHARSFIDVLIDAERLGIPIEQLIFQLSMTARHHRRRLAESSARRLPVQLAVPLVTCTLPSFVVLVIVPVIVATLRHLRIST